MSDPNLFAVIMAGGSGTRFWPASREERPKQFLPIAGGRAMITETHARLEGLVADENVLVVTAGGLAPLVAECLPGLPRENILVEPVGRNTAPCVALAAFEVARRKPGATQLVLPADQVIEPAEGFRRSLRAAIAEAREGGRLVTLGIRPTWAATGYGYIELGVERARHDDQPVREVVRFVEKPDAETAAAYIASGRFLWNAGIFAWRTDAILAALKLHAPDCHAALEGATKSFLPEVYAGLRPESVDVAVLEQAANVSVVPVDYAWNDVGSWTSLPEVHAPDSAGNCSAGGGRLLSEAAGGNIVFSEEGRLTALIGVQDLVVVHAGKATLVCPRERAQEVKKIVERLAEEGPDFL